MLDKLKSFASKFDRNLRFDPATLNDPVALSTEWHPLKPGGANFRTHQLKEISSYRIAFVMSITFKAMSILFFLFGLGILMVFLLLIPGDNYLTMEKIIPSSLGFIFMLVGYFIYRYGNRPIVFDKQLGYFWKGKKSPRMVLNISEIKHHAEIRQIHAVQVLSEYIKSSKRPYTSYEVNLVLKNGERLNVIDHGDRKKIQEDAQKVADFLEVPVWFTT